MFISLKKYVQLTKTKPVLTNYAVQLTIKIMFVFTDDSLFLWSALDQSIAKIIDIGEYVRCLSNCIGVSKGKGMTSEFNCVMPDNSNIVVLASNYAVDDKEKCVAIDAKCVV